MLNVFQLSNSLRHYDAYLGCTQSINFKMSINFKIHAIHCRTFITLQLIHSQRWWCEWCLGTRRHQLPTRDKQIVLHQASNGVATALGINLKK